MAHEQPTVHTAAPTACAPCSDAERRAARAVQRALRAAGRDAALETVWVRPRWAQALAAHAALAVLASLLAAAAPSAAAVALGAVLIPLLVEASGRACVLALLWPRRATQNVVAPAPLERPFHLIVTAHLDSGRVGLASRPALRRLGLRAQRAARGLLPGWFGTVVGALVLLLACAAARAGGAGGAGLAALQLMPTLFLLVVTALALDSAAAATGSGEDEAAALAATLALARTLDVSPPAALAVEVVIAGAGEGAALGLAAHLRARRRELDPARVAVLELAPGARGRVGWFSHEGPLLASLASPQLRRLAAHVAADEPHLGAVERRSRRRSAAHAARRQRLPALAVGRIEPVDGLEPTSPGDVLDFCLGLVLALDEELAPLATAQLASPG